MEVLFLIHKCHRKHTENTETCKNLLVACATCAWFIKVKDGYRRCRVRAGRAKSTVRGDKSLKVAKVIKRENRFINDKTANRSGPTGT